MICTVTPISPPPKNIMIYWWLIFGYQSDYFNVKLEYMINVVFQIKITYDISGMVLIVHHSR